MAGSKAASNADNAAKSAAKTAGKTTPGGRVPARSGPPRSSADLSPAAKEALRVRADDLGLNTVEAFRLDYQLIPELEAAGYSPEQIKSLTSQPNPYTAVEQFKADEVAAMSEAIRNSSNAAGIDPSKLSLRDLKATFDGLAVGQVDRPSGIRNKNPEASQAVETRLPDENTATTPAEMAETPGDKGGARETPQQRRDALRDFLGRGSEVFSDGVPAGGPGFFTQDMAGPGADFQSFSTPGGGIQRPTMIEIQAAPPRTPSMAEIEAAARGVTPPKGPKQRPQRVGSLLGMDLPSNAIQVDMGAMPEAVAPGRDAIVVGQQFDSGQPAGVIDATQRRAAASPSVQPAPAPEVAPKSASPAAEVPSAVKNSRILRGVKATGEHLKNNWFDYAVGGTAIGVPTAYGLGLFGGGSQQPQQQPSPQAGRRPIYILSREDLKAAEQRPAVVAPLPQAVDQPPQQQPAPRPAAGKPSNDQSTDVIRRLSGRMA